MTERKCNICDKEFRAFNTEVKRGGGKYCSRDCYYKAIPGLYESKNVGMKMSYAGVHAWVKRMKGMPQSCEECGKEGGTAFDWANLSGEYRRDLSDWKRLCRKCHMVLDNHPAKRKQTLLNRYGTTMANRNRATNGRFA